MGSKWSTLLIVMREKRIDKVRLIRRVYDRHQRGLGSKNVPQRKDRVIGKIFGIVGVLVETAIFAVHVCEQVRREHRVIHGCVKRLLLVFRAVDLDLAQCRIPFPARLFTHFIEVPVWNFRIQILQSVRGTLPQKWRLLTWITFTLAGMVVFGKDPGGLYRKPPCHCGTDTCCKSPVCQN